MGSGISSRPKPPVVARSATKEVSDEQSNTKPTAEIRSKDLREEGSSKFKIHEDIKEEGRVHREDREGDDEGEERVEFIDAEDEAMYNEAGEFFAHTALALGMDNQDLLFNLMYFDDGHASTFGSMMNSVQQETLALHSSNNTPYKLKPASESAIAGLSTELFVPSEGMDRECAVCKDEMEKGCQIIRIPACSHFFHDECLQGWCPVCRAEICLPASPEKESKSGKGAHFSPVARNLFADSEGKEDTE